MINKKSELEISTIFYIMMGIFMIAIIVFGFNKIFFVEKTLSNIEIVEIKSEISSALNHCEDPLAKGDKTTIKFRNNVFNSYCLVSGDVTSIQFFEAFSNNNIGYDSNDFQFLVDIYKDVTNIVIGGDNVILFNSKFHKNFNDEYILKDLVIVDSFKVDFSTPQIKCEFDLKGSGVFEMELIC